MQLALPFPGSHGGKRKNAGRKRSPKWRRRVAHRTRPVHRRSYPLHVTLRARHGLPPFREQALFQGIRDALQASRAEFRVLHFSVQTNHLHLIVEAHDSNSRSRGMQGLAIRVARRVNKILRIRGEFWRERYHAHTLRTPREVRNAIVYVLMNAKKHGRPVRGLDRFSSAKWFDGILGHRPEEENTPVASPRTWLAGVGWRRNGLIGVHESPKI